ncbi:MAG: DUF4367 domain-containing protein [Oscillospiraceae bacterium]|nr:DUF4367 domain-containing protein [Oscillospiraceae bacterium]
MDKITLLEILKTEPFSFTLREIEEIMDEELSKTPDEMDTELIDICADILDKEYSKENAEPKANNQKAKKFKVGKVLLIAAILIVILGLSLSASAKFLNIDASEKVVKFVNNHFHVDLGNENTDEGNYSSNGLELISDLNDYGFENITLPNALLSEEYSTKININSLENIERATVAFKSNSTNINGSIYITMHRNNNDSFAIGQSSVSDLYNQVKQISVNGIDLLIFSDNTTSLIFYIDKNIEYRIDINCDFDSAVEIAETIK